MEFKEYYGVLGVERAATQDEIKQAYRKLARKYHPDVSKEPNAEAKFKELGEAYKVLKDPETRAAYDRVGSQRQPGQDFRPPPGWDAGFEFSGGDAGADSAEFSEFFQSLFGQRGGRAQGHPHGMHAKGQDHHAKVMIDLQDAYLGAQRSISLQMPTLDADGHLVAQQRTLNVNIPKGVREGQHLRLAGQGGPGLGEAPAGDLYLEIAFKLHPHFRVDGRDVYFDLPIAPWEAALGAAISAPTPEGPVQLSVPPGSANGRKLRLKGKGIPGIPAGDLYAVLVIAVPNATTDAEKAAYRTMQAAFKFNPRAHLEG
jgi:curved DNA-binding protein